MNNVVINNTTVVNVQNINVYHNTTVRNAVVVVDENRFGRGPITAARVTQVDVKSLQPTHAGPQVTATAASFVPTATRGVRPPEASLKRAVVATRPPQAGVLESAPGAERKAGPLGTPTPAPAHRLGAATARARCDAGPSASRGKQGRAPSTRSRSADLASEAAGGSSGGTAAARAAGGCPVTRRAPVTGRLPRQRLRLRPVALRGRR